MEIITFQTQADYDNTLYNYTSCRHYIKYWSTYIHIIFTILHSTFTTSKWPTLVMWSCLKVNFEYVNLIPSRGGAESAPPTTYFVVKRLKHIERPCNFLTFPKYGFQTDLWIKKFNFLLGVPLSSPLENVEIYFSKIDIEIFASDTIFFIA